jgi:hypothetical protein
VHKADEFLLPELRRRDSDLVTIWFQKDGATAHTARQAMNTLRPVFEHRIISRYGDTSGSVRLPHCVFFLWGYLKSKMFHTRPANLHNLKDSEFLTKSVQSDQLLLRVFKSVLNRVYQGSSILRYDI